MIATAATPVYEPLVISRQKLETATPTQSYLYVSTSTLEVSKNATKAKRLTIE